MNEPVIPECICHRASPILCLVHRDSLVIPERYTEEYCAVTNAEHIPYRRQEVIIYELGAAEAKVAEQAAKIVELEAFKKSVLNSCIGCGYSLFLPQEPQP